MVSQSIQKDSTVMDKTDTTVFRNEAREASTTLLAHPADSLLDDTGSRISSFLAKPYEIFTGNWSTSDAILTSKWSGLLGSYLSVISEWAKKIEGFENIRGTAVLRVVINANPFQSGMLRLTFDPSYTYQPATWRYKTLGGISQLPGLDINCRDGIGTLRIPYPSISDFYNVKTSKYDWGLGNLIVLSQLVTGSGGETTVSISVYLSFEDIEISTPLVAQSGKARFATSKKSRRKPDTAIEAEIIGESGSLSKVFNTGSTFLTAVGSAVPAASAFTAPAAWVSSVLAGVASYFGYSKPNTSGSPHVVSQLKVPYMANTSGISTASVLALRHDNAVSTIDTSPTNYNEMSFDYLKQIPSIVKVGVMSTSDTTATVVLSMPLDLNQGTTYGTTFTGGNVLTSVILPPFAFLSRYFKYYRGSMKVRIKMIKTQFHNGRYMVTFTPSMAFTTSPNPGTSVLSIREIIDIAGPDEFELTLPYMLPQPWVDRTVSTAPNKGIGNLDIVCINGLRAPETASSTVEFLVYLAGGCDYEVMGPIDSVLGQNAILPAIIAQSGFEQIAPADNMVVSSTLAANIGTCGNDKTMAAAISGGEVFVSIKQLINKYSMLNNSGLSFTTSSSGLAYFATHFFGVPLATTGGSFTIPTMTGDPMSEIAQMFAFFRGSTRFVFTQGDNISSSISTSLNFVGTGTAPYGAFWDTVTVVPGVPVTSVISTPAQYATTFPSNNLMQVHNSSVGLAEVQAPFYHTFRLAPVQSRTIVVDSTGPLSVVLVRSAPPSDLSTSYLYVARSAGEDFQFSYFLGSPPVYRSYV
jgi:hypothetical protein